ncbi:MAG: hypothetical protein E7054_02245 [Lentisphaerae bacterium]|nr:hypothetical protein [Lentisphaerota bacterium]
MKRNSFTLIEILGVVVIITILATLGFAGYSYARNKSKESATQGLITRLNAAFEFAKQKSGFIPPASGSFVTINIDTANAKITINATDYKLATDATGKNKMYSEFYKNFIRTLEMDTMGRFMDGTQVIDAWGNPVYFRYPGILKAGGFDLISAGSDGTFGSGEASTPPTSLDKYRDGAEWICDDIANF